MDLGHSCKMDLASSILVSSPNKHGVIVSKVSTSAFQAESRDATSRSPSIKR